MRCFSATLTDFLTLPEDLLQLAAAAGAMDSITELDVMCSAQQEQLDNRDRIERRIMQVKRPAGR